MMLRVISTAAAVLLSGCSSTEHRCDAGFSEKGAEIKDRAFKAKVSLASPALIWLEGCTEPFLVEHGSVEQVKEIQKLSDPRILVNEISGILDGKIIKDQKNSNTRIEIYQVHDLHLSK